MIDLLPDQIRVLAKVLNSKDVLISAELGIDRQEASSWLAKCESLAITHAVPIQGKHFAFAFDGTQFGASDIALSDLLSAINGNGSILILDRQGKLIKTVLAPVTVSASIERTKKNGGLEILVHGTYLYNVLAGNIINERDVLDDSKLPPAGISFYRPTRQLKELIHDHAEQELRRETGVRYWADRQKRLLLATPESTEKIFQRSLLSWLRHFVNDKLRIFAETRGFGQDATDITIVTGHGEYVVEVKWMGKNEHGTEYGDGQILYGVKQIAQYLDNDQRLIKGTVAIYDGRKNKPSIEYEVDRAVMHIRCDIPQIIWLESETPSQIASAGVSGKKDVTRQKSKRRGIR